MKITLINQEEITSISGAQILFKMLEQRQLSNVFPETKPHGISGSQLQMPGFDCDGGNDNE